MITKYLASLTTFFSRGNLTSKAYLNTLASLLEYISRLLVGFVTNPIIVNTVGLHLYGIWQFLGRWSGYTTLAAGRPSIALRWKIANLQASDDFAEKRRILGSAIIVWLLMAPLFVLLGGALIWLTPLLIKTGLEYYSTIRITIALLLAGNLLLGIAELPRYILQGENLAYKRMGLSTLMSLGGGALMILLLYLKAGIIGMASVFAIMILAEGTIFLQVARKNIQWIGVEWPSLSEVKGYFSLNWWYMGGLIVFQLLQSSDLVLLGLLSTPDAVAIYSLNKYVPDVAISLVIMILGGVLPGMGIFIGRKEFDRLGSLRGELFAIIWMIGVAISSVALMWNRSFVTLWVGAEKYAGIIVTLLVTLKVFQFILFLTDAAVLDLILEMKVKVLFGLVSLFTSSALAVIAVNILHMGITGLVLGFLLGQIIPTIAYPMLITKYLKERVSGRWIKLARPGTAGVVVLAISFILGRTLTVNDWFSLIGLCAVTFIVALGFAYFSGLPNSMRMQILKRAPFLR